MGWQGYPRRAGSVPLSVRRAQELLASSSYPGYDVSMECVRAALAPLRAGYNAVGYEIPM